MSEEKLLPDVKDIRLQDLKESIVRLRVANSEGNKTLVDIYCMMMADQLKSLEFAISGAGNE